MKKLTAAAILAAATLAGPVAVGQAPGVLDQSATFSTQDLVKVAVPQTLLPSPSVPRFERDAGSSGDDDAPRPVASWVMALAFLGFVALRRTGT
jgi:MYXO-CTERM domain-containing protein